MANALQPGCVRSPSGRYLPTVFEAHGRVFFGGKSYLTPEGAVDWAKMCIEDLSYQYWHYHGLADNHA